MSKLSAYRPVAAPATHSFAPTAAQRSLPTVQAGGNAIALTPAATKPAGRAILRFQRLPAGVAQQSHDPLKITAFDQWPAERDSAT